MNDRRRFIALVPFAGLTLLAACSKESPPPPGAHTGARTRTHAFDRCHAAAGIHRRGCCQQRQPALA